MSHIEKLIELLKKCLPYLDYDPLKSEIVEELLRIQKESKHNI
jgi:hypothetical protein